MFGMKKDESMGLDYVLMMFLSALIVAGQGTTPDDATHCVFKLRDNIRKRVEEDE